MFAPASIKDLTSSNWFLLTAVVSAVYPLGET